MVKTILSILISAALLAGAAVFENNFVGRQFGELETALTALEDKVRGADANRADAEVVKTLWENKKKKTARRDPAQRHLLHRLLAWRSRQLCGNEKL